MSHVDAYPHPSSDYLAGIGRIALAHADLEQALQSAIVARFPATSPATFVVQAIPGFQALCDVFNKAYSHRPAADVLVKEIRAVNQQRNQFVHGPVWTTWTFDGTRSGGVLEGQKSLQMRRRNGDLVNAPTVSDLNALAQRIEAATETVYDWSIEGRRAQASGR